MSSTQSPLGPPSLPDTYAGAPADEHAPAGLIQAGRGTPPPELLAEMAAADAARTKLLAGGQVVRFNGGDGCLPLQIELCELDGTVVRELSIAEALALTGSGME